MIFPKDIAASVVRSGISVGDVFAARMDKSNGITPKEGYNSRRKFFVVLGITEDGFVYGGVVVNSQINKNTEPAKKVLQYPLDENKYDFLEHNSFVNCAELKTLTFEQLLKAECVGKIIQEDLDLIMGAVIGSPFVEQATLERFQIQ